MIPVRLADLSASEETHRIFLLPTGGTIMSSTVTDNIYERPEVLRLSDAAFRMHVRALAWAAAHGTAPDLPDYALPSVSPLTGGVDLITELVGAGLWRATDIDDLGYVIDGELPTCSHANCADAVPDIPYRVEGASERVIGFFPEIWIATCEHRSKGTPFSRRVLRGLSRAQSIVDTAENLLLSHARDGHHDLKIDVPTDPAHPHIRVAGDRADEWLRSALAAGQLTADVPDWRGHSHPELSAFVEGTSCYPGWAAAS